MAIQERLARTVQQSALEPLVPGQPELQGPAEPMGQTGRREPQGQEQLGQKAPLAQTEL